MSLTSNQIESLLLDGLYCRSEQREFTLKLDQISEIVSIRENDRLIYSTIPIEYILDRTCAGESGSEIADEGALKRFLGKLAADAG